jgi:Flp pilus assembly protein TadD
MLGYIRDIILCMFLCYISCYDKILAIKPEDTAVLGNKGLALAYQGRADEAMPYIDKALSIKPNDPIILNVKAVALSKLGEYDEALKYIALTIDPNYATALDNKRKLLNFMHPPLGFS